jgi:hypothetical protein
MAITLAEYNRRWDLIMEAYRSGHLTRGEASDAVQELVRQEVQR